MTSVSTKQLRTTTLIEDNALTEAAFRALFDDVSPRLLRVSMIVCGDRDLAKDAVQNAWQKAWSRRAELRDLAKGKAWLMAIATNEARMLARRERMRTRIEGLVLRTVEPIAALANPALADLDVALRRLSPDDRALLALKYVAGYTPLEIGPLVGKSPASVRVRLSRLRQRLRKELDQ